MRNSYEHAVRQPAECSGLKPGFSAVELQIGAYSGTEHKRKITKINVRSPATLLVVIALEPGGIKDQPERLNFRGNT
jgi:hypothetical protein